MTDAGKSVFLPTFASETLDNTNLVSRNLTREFYKTNNYHLAWVDSAGLRSAADSMLSIIRSAETLGLIPADYHLAELDQLLGLPHTNSTDAAIDHYLTDGFFTMWHHLKHGRLDKKTLARIVLSDIKDDESIISLTKAFEKNTFRERLALQEPDFKEYHALKGALQELINSKHTDSVTLFRKNQLVANMERWRWQTSLPDRYISVNVPSFMLKVMEKDSVILQSKIIVGKKETPTPEIESVIRSFIIYPYWHVPKSIVKEILPHIQEDSLYLRRHNYDVLDNRGVINNSSIDWLAYNGENFPFVLRQREGSENTMGVIKFVFSNNYGVYLHDTNARGLFSKEDRALSHGCIRVQKAKALARYLAKDDDTYVSPEDLDVYFLLQRRMEVKIVKPIPLLLQYFTCVEKNGAIHFYEDIYGKDEAIIKALYNRTEPLL